jgi:hypothetical protein
MDDGDSGVALRRVENVERRPSGRIRRISARASSVSCGKSAMIDQDEVKGAVRGRGASRCVVDQLKDIGSRGKAA